MRNITIGVVSFSLGLICAGLLGLGSPHTSIVRQLLGSGVFAQTKTPLPLPPVPPNLTFNPWTPSVPALPRTISSGNINELQIVQIDGRNSEGETFRNSVLVYGGGAYRLAGARLDGAFQIALVGAAANTAQFMQTFGMIGCPAPAPKAQPRIDMNAPRIERTTLTVPISGDFVSPYGSK